MTVMNSTTSSQALLFNALLRKQVSDTLQNLSNLRVKQGGFGIPNLQTTATSQCSTSKKSTDHLINAIKGREDFNIQVHLSRTDKAKKEHGGFFFRKTGKREEKKPTALLREEETFHSLPNHY